MVTSIFIIGSGLHGTLLIAISVIVSYLYILGYKYKDIKQAIYTGLAKGMPAMVIFLLIGLVIVTFIQSGTVPTLVYYGLKFIDPVVFLPAGLILCSLMSLATGTSWGTVGTGGIVLIGMALAMDIPLPVVAGMIISGASFGDKMSPVSDTTNLAAISANTDLYDHIKSMLYTTVPTYILVLIIFSIVGTNYYSATAENSEKISELMQSLDDNFTVNPLMITPMLLLLVLSIKKVPAEVSMVVSSMLAAIFAYCFQDYQANTIISGFYDGNSSESGNDTLDILLNRGGMVDMTWTFTISLLAISMGAILDKFNILQHVVEKLLHSIKTTGNVIASCIVTNFSFNLALGESYVSIIMSSQMFKSKFDKLKINRNVLSRSCEEGSTLLTSLIPWTTTGVFYYATLGVAVIDYAPWALLNWINPIVGIIFGYLGIAIFRIKPSTGSGTEMGNEELKIKN